MSIDFASPRTLSPRVVLSIIAAATFACAAPARAGAAGPPDSTAARVASAAPAPSLSVAPPATRLAAFQPAGRLFSRDDVWFGLGAAAATFAVSTADRSIADESIESDTHAQRSLARLGQPLGNVGVVGPALLALYGGAWLTGHHALQASTERVGLSVIAAGVMTTVLKEAVGRSRPLQTPGEPDEFKPFSGHESFPSGHTTVAFAAARAIDLESGGSWWTRAVVYPTAMFVAWSRIHDRQHWLSDVVAGAAVGTWSATKVESFMLPAHHGGAGLTMTPLHSGMGVGVGTKF